MVVHTTLDSRVQQALSNAFNSGIRNNQEILNGKTDSDGKIFFDNINKEIGGNFSDYIIIAEKNDDISFAEKVVSLRLGLLSSSGSIFIKT